MRESDTKNWKAIVPNEMAKSLTHKTHEVYGYTGKYHVLKTFCTFTSMHRAVSEVVRTFDTCQRTKLINFWTDGSTMLHQPTSVLETISLDLMGLLPLGIVVLVDTFSKYIK